jgi:hypothetical protein
LQAISHDARPQIDHEIAHRAMLRVPNLTEILEFIKYRLTAFAHARADHLAMQRWLKFFAKSPIRQ